MDRIRPELEAPLRELQYALDDDEGLSVLPASAIKSHGAFFGRLLLALGGGAIQHTTIERDDNSQSSSAVIFTQATRIHIVLQAVDSEDPTMSVSVRSRRPLLAFSVDDAPDAGARDTYYTWPQGAVLTLSYPDGEVIVRPRKYVRDADREAFLSFLESLRLDLIAHSV